VFRCLGVCFLAYRLGVFGVWVFGCLGVGALGRWGVGAFGVLFGVWCLGVWCLGVGAFGRLGVLFRRWGFGRAFGISRSLVLDSTFRVVI